MTDGQRALESLIENLATLDRAGHVTPAVRAAYPDARLSAVIALFYPIDGEPHIVLTRRSPHLSQHSGQISFPGGKLEPTDATPAAAALRETHEELGVPSGPIALHGSLEPVYTQVSNFVLLPLVGSLASRPDFNPDPREVADVIEVPLAHLVADRVAQEEVWDLRGIRRRVGFYRFGEHRVWGVTARILRQVIQLSGGPGPPPGIVLPGEVEPDSPISDR